MGSDGERETRNVWKKLGVSGVVAAVGAGVGLLLTMKPKRLRDAVSELPGSARNLAEDLTQRVHAVGGDAGRPMPQEISDDFEARRRERKERRERRRRHTTT